MTNRQEIDSYDMDDFVLGRQFFVRFASTVYAADLPIQGKESVSFWLHKRRKVVIGAKAHLQNRSEDGVYIVGNTGRRATKKWEEMTWDSLRSGGVDRYFQRIFFTPKGVSPTRSKMHAIAELSQFGQVTHYDDDPRTAISISK